MLLGRLRVRRIYLRIKRNLDTGGLVAVLDDNVDLFKVLQKRVQVSQMGSATGIVATEFALAVKYVPRIDYGRVLRGFNRATSSLLAYSIKPNASPLTHRTPPASPLETDWVQTELQSYLRARIWENQESGGCSWQG